MDLHSNSIKINTESLIPENSDLHSDTKEINTENLISESSDLHSEIEIPDVSIFEVPESITIKKPEAYKPQQLGFGPHRGPENTRGPKTKMEQRKRVVVQKVLQRHKIDDFKLTVVAKVQQIVPDIRECYEMLLQDDDASVARDFATDGLFLLDLLESYDRTSSRDRLLAPDIMMVENQIPFIVLKEIHKALRPSSSGDTFSADILRSFTEIRSPFELCSSLEASTCHVEHLLDYMYKSIIFKGQESVINVTNFVEKVPQRESVQLYEQIIISLHNFSVTNIANASASKLHGIAGVTFKHQSDVDRIGDIKFKENCLHLPCITLNDHSEVILRNLVAYETLTSYSYGFPLTTYMGLMCWLVADVEDVKILRKENIIKGDLSDEEIAKIFVEMNGLIGSLKTEAKSYLQKKIDEVNKVYQSMPVIKAYLFLKKLAKWLLVVLTAIGSFVGATWKIVAFLISIVTVFTLTYKAYCDAYGCDKESVTLLSYSSI